MVELVPLSLSRYWDLTSFLLVKVKDIWDPMGVFNPGKIVHPNPKGKNLRYSPDYKPLAVPTVFKWRKLGGFNDSIELCNGWSL